MKKKNAKRPGTPPEPAPDSFRAYRVKVIYADTVLIKASCREEAEEKALAYLNEANDFPERIGVEIKESEEAR